MPLQPIPRYAIDPCPVRKSALFPLRSAHTAHATPAASFRLEDFACDVRCCQDGPRHLGSILPADDGSDRLNPVGRSQTAQSSATHVDADSSSIVAPGSKR